MAAETSGRARACFDLKRTTFPLFSLVLRSTDLAELQSELHARIGQAPDFFDQDLLVLNLSSVRREQNDLDFAALVAVLRGYGLQPIGVHGGSVAQMAAAADAGLVPTPEVSVASSIARTGGRTPLAREGAVADEAATGEAGTGEAARDEAAAVETATGEMAGGEMATGQAATGQAAAYEQARGITRQRGAVPQDGIARDADAAAASPAVAQGTTVVIDKPLRSGQRVYAKNADLVVLETVSFGAEVFADGNVHVYAPLRGRAIAGARGNAEARIFTTCLDPQLVAIAGVYRTIETALPDEVAGKPAQIRRVGDSLLIEPL